MRKIICIGRQFGSGGHTIARKLAEELDIPYYDKKIFEQAVSLTEIPGKVFQDIEEKKAHPLLQPIFFEGSQKEYYGMTAHDILFETQKKVILQYAHESDCVMVGRCADFILKENTDYAVKSIFIVAPMAYRIKNTMDIDHLDERSAASAIRKADKARSAYYNYYTGKNWGKPSDYDYCINAMCSEDEVIRMLKYLFYGLDERL